MQRVGTYIKALVLVWVAGSLQAGSVFQDASQMMSFSFIPESVLAYDDHHGSLTLTAHGDHGSRIDIRCRFDGFYVVPNLMLSKALAEGIDYRNMEGDWKDVYQIIPQTIHVNITAHTQSVIESEPPYHYRKVDRKLESGYSYTHTNSPPPGKGGYLAMTQWLREVRDPVDSPVKSAFTIVSRQPEGGEAYVEGYVSFEDIIGETSVHSIDITYPPLVPAVRKKTFDDVHETSGRFSFRAQANPGEIPDTHHFQPDFPLSRAWVLVDAREAMRLNKEISLDDLSFSFSGASPTEWVVHTWPQGTVSELLSDSSYQLQYDLQITGAKTLKAELKPLGENEKDWCPAPNERRDYQLTLIKPDYREVEAVRFVLEDVSEHQGIAVNAGCHRLYEDECPHCEEGVSLEEWSVSTGFHGYTIERCYSGYNECPVDSLPDMYFTNTDNPGWDQGGEVVSEGLRYSISSEISMEGQKINRPQYLVSVRVMDAAAAARLYAEVRIGGIWYKAEAKGDTAESGGEYLMIPLDQDRDGIADAWEEEFDVSAGRDSDVSANFESIGDGLTGLEEYRGVYICREHKRLDPERHDLFVHDYTGRFREQLGLLQSLYYKEEGIDLHALTSREFREEIVNCYDSSAKSGDQYLIVIMDQYTQMTDSSGRTVGGEEHTLGYSGKASRIGPPVKGGNTVVASTGYGDALERVGLLGHEIGHNINCRHHGERDGFVNIPETVVIDGQEFSPGRYYAAVKGGQHSGCIECFMRYTEAHLYCEKPDIMLPVADYAGLYHIFPENARGSREKFCTSFLGTGPNADGGVCGDAEKGNCKAQIIIKSY